MGVGRTFGEAFAKAQLGAGVVLPTGGTAVISVKDSDKAKAIQFARDIKSLGFRLIATDGTAKALQEAGIECTRVNKVVQGRPHIVDLIKNGEIQLIVNTAQSKQAVEDSFALRRAALRYKITYTTTIAGALATSQAIMHMNDNQVYRLQDLHEELVQ